MIKELRIIKPFSFFILCVGTRHYDVQFSGPDSIIFLFVNLKWIIAIYSNDRFSNQSSLLKRRLFNILLHFLSEHRFKCFKYFVFIILFQHIWKLCNLFTFFAAGNHFVSIDVEFYETLLWRFWIVEFNTAKFIITFFSLAIYFMSN